MVNFIVVILLLITYRASSAKNMSQCVGMAHPLQKINCNNNLDWIRFGATFLNFFDFLYIDVSSTIGYLDVALCSCKWNECMLRICACDALNIAECTSPSPVPGLDVLNKHLQIYRKTVDVFEYPFRWTNESKTWKICDEKRILVDQNESTNSTYKNEIPTILTKNGFFDSEVVDGRIRIGKCRLIQEETCSDMPELPTNNIKCDDSTDWIHFDQLMYNHFDFIYVGRVTSKTVKHLELAGCDCALGKCLLFCCSWNKILSFSECNFYSLSTKFLFISGEKVNVFQHSFRWTMNKSETWKLCDERNPLLARRKNMIERTGVAPKVFTENGFFTGATLVNANVTIINCLQFQDNRNTDGGTDDFWRKYTYWMHVVSIPFAILTIIVYILLPNLRNLHGMSLISLLICVALHNISKFHSVQYMNDYKNQVCNILSHLNYFLSMSQNLWMIVIGFDLWWTFCVRTLPRNKSSTLRTLLARLLAYSIFAWGIPLFISALIWIYYSSPYEYRVGYFYYCQEINCCMNKMQQLATDTLYHYFEIISSILNLVLLIFTFTKIQFTKRQIEVRDGRTNQSNVTKMQRNIENFWQFLRLFVIMNAKSIFLVVLLYLRRKYFSRFYLELSWYCIITVGNSDGILIFLLFVLKKRTRSDIWKR